MDKFKICNHCGNMVGMLNNVGVPLLCCGEEMETLIPNTKEASTEKHLPVISVNGNKVEVAVGSTLHPMLDEHNIAWIYLQTENGGQRKSLKVGAEPKATFLLENDKPIAAFAYCNLHGLWMTKI